MKFSKYRQESRPLFLSLELLNIYELNIYQIVLFMYSHCSHYHGNLPLAFTDYFSRNDAIDQHNNRSSTTKLHINYKRKTN